MLNIEIYEKFFVHCIKIAVASQISSHKVIYSISNITPRYWIHYTKYYRLLLRITISKKNEKI